MCAFSSPMFPQDDDLQIKSQNVRKVWHKGEWYFSVIDVIAELVMCDHRKAKSYWSTLKERLKKGGDEAILQYCLQVRLKAVDNKVRFTDVINYAGVSALEAEFLKPAQRRLKSRLLQRKDEVQQFHPLVQAFLEQEGYKVAHHFLLPSGHEIDFVATKDKQTLVIECKPSLDGQNLYAAIGQTLCYSAEFHLPAIPCIATPPITGNEYILEMCSALNILLLEVNPLSFESAQVQELGA